MKIRHTPPLLTAEERDKLAAAKTFCFNDGRIITDNGQWWYCAKPKAAREYLRKNGVEEIKYKPII